MRVHGNHYHWYGSEGPITPGYEWWNCQKPDHHKVRSLFRRRHAQVCWANPRLSDGIAFSGRITFSGGVVICCFKGQGRPEARLYPMPFQLPYSGVVGNSHTRNFPRASCTEPKYLVVINERRNHTRLRAVELPMADHRKVRCLIQAPPCTGVLVNPSSSRTASPRQAASPSQVAS